MNFEASRAKAIDKLNNFVEKNLSDYSRLRNFDFGPDKRDNVSCLSPYVTHGVLNEIEIMYFMIHQCLSEHSKWRTFFDLRRFPGAREARFTARYDTPDVY